MFLHFIKNLDTTSSDNLPESYENDIGLDPDLPWYDEIDEAVTATLLDLDEYNLTAADIQVGDIVLGDVYQDNDRYYNLKHKTRPFLVTSKTADMVKGFQLTHDPAYTIKSGSVPVEDFIKCGLNGFGYITLNMRRGLKYDYIKRVIGHISEATKTKVIDKLREMSTNKQLGYSDFPILKVDGLIDTEIENLYTIVGR